MPFFTPGNLAVLLAREPGKVHLMIGNAGRIVLCFREWSQKGWRYCPLGSYSQGNGWWVRYANADTELDLTEWHDVHGIWTDAGEVPHGEAVMEQAAKVWAQHYKNKEGTTASQHFLADVFAQATVKENGDIQLGLKWVMDYFRRIFAVESVFGDQFMLCNEKVHATGAFLRSGAPVTGLLLGDDEEVLEGCRVFIGDSNYIQQNNGVDYIHGSRIGLTTGFYEYFQKKKHILVIIELSRTFTGAIHFDMIACEARTLLHLLDSGKLWNYGEDPKDVTQDPRWHQNINSGKKPGDDGYIKRYDSTDKVIRVNGKIMKLDSDGKYQGKLNPKTTQQLFVDDFIACAKTKSFPGCVLVEGAKPETAMAALVQISALGGGVGMDDPMDDEARKLAADQSAEAIREAYAREQAAAAANAAPAPDDDDKAAPLVQGVDDEWADWRGCVCGGSYYGEMVACDGHCDNWFHFACVGLTRLPRGEWLCQDCAPTKPKKRRVEKQPELYKCGGCDRTFTAPVGLRNHYRTNEACRKAAGVGPTGVPLPSPPKKKENSAPAAQKPTTSI